MNNRLIYILLGLVVVLLVFAVIAKKNGWVGKSTTIKVAVEETGVRSITETVPANGNLYAKTEVSISSEVSGEVIDLKVEEGDSVIKGQLLLKINGSNYESARLRAKANLNQNLANEASSRANLTQTEAQLEQALATYNRNQQLYQKNIISAAEFESSKAAYKTTVANKETAIQQIKAAQYNVESARATVQEADDNFRKTTIYAPISGIVSRLSIELGEKVVGTAQMAGTELLKIADLNNMEIRVDVSENDILRVSIGDTAEIEIDAYGGRKFKGIVNKMAYSAGSGELTQENVADFQVRISLLKSSYKDLINEEKGHKYPFRPDMSATVDIRTEKVEGVIAVPIQSVTTRDEKVDKGVESSVKASKKEVVFLVEAGKVIAREVKTGVQDDKYIEIVEGLQENDQVVIAPFRAISRSLNDGDQVMVTSEEELFE